MLKDIAERGDERGLTRRIEIGNFCRHRLSYPMLTASRKAANVLRASCSSKRGLDDEVAGVDHQLAHRFLLLIAGNSSSAISIASGISGSKEHSRSTDEF